MNVDYKPKNPIASYVDVYGETRIIHKPKGRRLSVFCGGNTVALRMNRASAILIGKKIKEIRLKKGMSQRTLCVKAGLQNANPKQYIHAIENATRQAGSRMGTLYAIAYALECEVYEIVPTIDEVMKAAGVSDDTKTLSV